MIGTLAHGYSSDRTRRTLSNEYQYDRVWMVFKIICVIVLGMQVALSLVGLTPDVLKFSR